MKKREYLALQLFANPAPTPTVEQPTEDPDPKEPLPKPGDPEPKEPKNEPQKADPKYTDDDVDKILSRKFAEWEKKQQQKVDEAKRLAEMNAQQKAEYERDVLQKKLDEFMKKDELTEMSKAARTMLSEKGINVGDDLISKLVSEDAESTKKSVDAFITMFQEATKKAVANALKGEVPKAGGSSTMTKEQIMAVANRMERQRLIKENMELFK